MRRALSVGLVFAVAAMSGSGVRAQGPPETPEQFYQRLAGQQRLPSAPVRSEGSGVTAQDVVFQSRTLDREMRYRVLLPASYGSSHRYYPVLYLLHGYMNTYYDWDKQTNLARYLEKYDLVVVLPQFDNSFYLNSAGEPKDRYITYFFRDLTPDVESRFRARTESQARAVGGVSMGGVRRDAVGPSLPAGLLVRRRLQRVDQLRPRRAHGGDPEALRHGEAPRPRRQRHPQVRRHHGSRADPRSGRPALHLDHLRGGRSPPRAEPRLRRRAPGAPRRLRASQRPRRARVGLLGRPAPLDARGAGEGDEDHSFGGVTAGPGTEPAVVDTVTAPGSRSARHVTTRHRESFSRGKSNSPAASSR
ncbi:MAG: hypothetical protein HY049_10680 [Acidobacteria bacterium]|nr:hypothetical protein [Acidobacteriota bacterium]